MSFLDALSQNYAHWITEVLVNINFYIKHSNCENGGIPILLDMELNDNMIESAKLIIGNRPIIYVEDCAEVIVENLFVVNSKGHVPYSYRDWNGPRNNGYFDINAMISLRENVLSKIATTNKFPKKIYVKRCSTYRNILNPDEVERFLSSVGFSIVMPETMSFADQVILFNNADHIIGTTGAAMANIIFTKPDCKINILFNSSRYNAFEYWKNIGECTGNQIDSNIFGSSVTGDIHSDFRVRIEELKNII